MKTRISLFLISLFLILLSGKIISITAQDRKNALGSTTMRESNLYAPDLYSETIKLKVSLSSLPGAAAKGSTWETSYQIYFIAESEYYGVIDHLPPGGHNLQAEDFPNRVLLGEGRIKKDDLSSPQTRAEVLDGISLRSKVPEHNRTKFGRLITAYSVKIYDAQLKLPIYHSGVFVTYVFEKAPSEAGAATARLTLYLGFTVTPSGQLTYSQLANPR